MYSEMTERLFRDYPDVAAAIVLREGAQAKGTADT
jgi:hypothetical protein